MSREEAGPDFVEALARGIDVLRCFGDTRRPLTLSEVAAASGLARATARRLIITLEHLGYVRSLPEGYVLSPRVLELGTAHTLSSGIWDLARMHLVELVEATNQAASIAELDGADIFYVARVAVPKMVSLSVTVGMRLPAENTALGKVLLAALSPEELDLALATAPRNPIVPHRPLSREQLRTELREVRARGWALTDEEIHPGVRSVAAPLRDGNGRVFAAINVAVVAAEVSLSQLIDGCLPMLLRAAGQISSDRAMIAAAPQLVLGSRA